MMRRRHLLIVVFLASALALASCAPKKPEGPPQELVDEISGVESLYRELSAHSPTEEDSAAYQALINAARSDMNAGDYAGSMQKARQARLEASKLYALLIHRELMEYNPPNTMTYHYRQQMKNAEDAEKKGDIDGAIGFANEARNQASLALDLQKQCLEDSGARLVALKGRIEQLFKPDYRIIQLYWSAMASVPERNCEKTKGMVDSLERMIDEFETTTISQKLILYVNAPFDYVRTYGDPWMYGEVRADGYLENRVSQVPVGTPVLFVNSMLFSSDKTFYFVEDTRNGKKGWMAEERVWPERAVRH